MGEPLYRLFERAAESAGGRTALDRPDGAINYARLHEEIADIASRLCGELERDGPVAVLTEDATDLLRGFFAAAAVGRPALLLDPALPLPTLARLLDRHPPGVLLTSSKQARMAASLPHPTVHIGEPSPPRESPPLPQVTAQQEFYWGLTSGTTGESKLFARSHASWTASFEAAEAVCSFPPHSRVLIPGPLHHSLFLYGAAHALCRGLTVLLPGPFRPSRIAPYLRAATHLYAVPFMLGELAKLGCGAPNLRAIFCGGAKLSAEQRQTCEHAWPGADLVEFYGASETSFLTFHSTRRPAPAGSVGRAFPGVQLEIRDPAAMPLADGQEGEIFASSPMLFSRYVGEASVSGWFSAGDLGFRDGEGCLHLTGRVNRIINSRALKIRPELIEAALMELPEVRRVAVVGIPEPSRGAIPVAVIETDGSPIRRHTLSAHCRRTLGAKLCPCRYYIADALPLTASGKVAVAEIRARVLAHDAAFRELR